MWSVGAWRVLASTLIPILLTPSAPTWHKGRTSSPSMSAGEGRDGKICKVCLLCLGREGFTRWWLESFASCDVLQRYYEIRGWLTIPRVHK
jgi:hypothetical protein